MPRMEIRVFENRLRLTNLETHKSIERAAEIPFSSAETIVADATHLATLLRAMIVELEGRRRILAWPSLTVRFTASRTGPSQIERKAITAMATEMGFSRTDFAG